MRKLKLSCRDIVGSFRFVVYFLLRAMSSFVTFVKFEKEENKQPLTLLAAYVYEASCKTWLLFILFVDKVVVISIFVFVKLGALYLLFNC